MMVIDKDNIWRSPTYDERRDYQDSLRIFKRPYRLNEHLIIQPDNQQPDGFNVAHKVPERFIAVYESDWVRALAERNGEPVESWQAAALKWVEERKKDKLSRMEWNYPNDLSPEIKPLSAQGDT